MICLLFPALGNHIKGFMKEFCRVIIGNRQKVRREAVTRFPYTIHVSGSMQSKDPFSFSDSPMNSSWC